jgi:hypothetical protein
VAAAVLIVCPETDELIPIGVKASDLAGLPFVNHLEACLACGGSHEWTKDDAVVTTTTDSWATT